jgi:membrane protease YdiL (CAAX protease family)
VATAAAGAFLCWLRLASGSLLPPAAAHWAVNATGFVSGWVAARRFRHVTT